jgi:hypothetical protein
MATVRGVDEGLASFLVGFVLAAGLATIRYSFVHTLY